MFLQHNQSIRIVDIADGNKQHGMRIPDETLRSATSHVPAGRYIAGSMKKGWRTVKRIEKNRELERERERERDREGE